MTHKRVIFDNGGGTTVQIGDLAHHFDSAKEAAETVLDYRCTGTEDDEVTSDPYDDPIGYRVGDIGDETDVDYRDSWRNLEIFFDFVDSADGSEVL